MKIEVGKRYRMRDGEVTGIIYQSTKVTVSDGTYHWWADSGQEDSRQEGSTDIVAEWDGWSDWTTLTDKDYFPNLVKGKDYECFYVDGVFKYRVKDREPEVKEVVNYFYVIGSKCPELCCGVMRDQADTHKITIKIIDGVIQPQALIETL